MRSQLDNNVNLLLVYFNVMIMSKAFRVNKAFQMINNNKSLFSRTVLEEASNTEELESSLSSNNSRSSSMLNQNAYSNNRTKTINSINSLKTPSYTSNYQIDYDADTELSVLETFNENSRTTSYRYDLILFPRILELCLSYILNVKQQQRMELSAKLDLEKDLEIFDSKYLKFNTITEAFLKRLLYLLESCHFNIQIILNNVSFECFMNLEKLSFVSILKNINFIEFLFVIF